MLIKQTLEGSSDGVNMTFTVQKSMHPSCEMVHVNGVMQDSPGDYICPDRKTITFTSAPPSNAVMVVISEVLDMQAWFELNVT